MVDKGLEIFIPYRKDCAYGKGNQEMKMKQSSKQSTSESLPRKNTINLSSLDFSEDDFIVFSLQEDGAIHRKTGKHANGDCTITNPEMHSSRKVNEKLTTHVYRTKKTAQEFEKQEEISGAESSDSYQSDASSGSFAFPVLSYEGSESPAKMPKPETLHFWKQKKWGVLCLCKRF